MSGIQQMLMGGTYKAAPPTTIGQAYGGGFYAGKISTTANAVATHYLVVAPKASGENSARLWGVTGVTTGINSEIDGPTNSASLAALGASYEAATFCEGLSIGGYTDWYLPAKNELEVLYYFLKPSISANNTSSGANNNAVSPEPQNSNYSSGTPAQTNAGIGFRDGETNAFILDWYWNSTEYDSNYARAQNFDSGFQSNGAGKETNRCVRAVRRIPV